MKVVEGRSISNDDYQVARMFASEGVTTFDAAIKAFWNKDDEQIKKWHEVVRETHEWMRSKG